MPNFSAGLLTRLGGGAPVSYFLYISVFATAVTVLDKLLAKVRAFRIPEAWLFLLAAAGGSAAMFVTMLLIRHKTRHFKFMFGLPVMMVLQAAIVWMLWSHRLLRF